MYQNLIIINLLVFIIEIFDRQFIYLFGFIPEYLFIEPWRLVTSIFLHANFFHIFLNMFVLYNIGPLIERRIGSIEFLKLYLISGIVGNILFGLVAYSGIIPTNTIGIGASGAIAGLLGAAFLFYPYLNILFLFIIPMPMYVFFFFYILIEFAGIFTMNYTGIGSAAHLGGVIAGYFYSKYLYDKYW